MKNTDSYLEELGLSKIGYKKLQWKKIAITYLKISIVFPFVMLWRIIKFLFNPTKSVVRGFKKTIVFPLLEFFTGKNTSEQILGDYTYIHQSILKKEKMFNGENIKLNFEAHRSILLNSKIATVISFIVLLLIYEFAFEILGDLQLMAFALSFVTAGITAFLGVLFWIFKAFLTFALFSVEIYMIRALVVTERDEIKDYLDETIFYADVKNSEIFGLEHSEKVKNALYDAYLTEKQEVQYLGTDLLDKYITHEKAQLPNFKQNIVQTFKKQEVQNESVNSK